LGLKDLFRKKDETAFNFSAGAAQQDLGNPNQTTPEQEAIETAGKIAYLLDSETMKQFFHDNPDFRVFIPAFQSVIRTTKINNHEAEMMWLNFKIMFLMKKAEMPKKLYAQGAMTLFQSLTILADSIITDAKDGWKGHLTTENVRRLDVMLNKKDHAR
jgi:hypothetical protein